MSTNAKFLMLAASPLWGPFVLLGFLWQFVDYGWTVGNVLFNHLIERTR